MMKGILLFCFCVALLSLCTFAYAAVNQATTPVTGMVGNDVQSCIKTAWSSRGPREVVSFQNGTGATLVIQIMVDANQTLTGVNLSNCGTTTHIDSGSTAICVTNDPRNPVSFVTDNPVNPVSGAYIVQLLR